MIRTSKTKSLNFVLSLLTFLLLIGCTTANVEPVIVTAAVRGVTSNSAVAGGLVTSEGATAVTTKGICWSTSASPTLSNSYLTDSSGIASFSCSITGLSPNTLYHVRAYAINSKGTSYGNEVSFTTTPPADPVLPTLSTVAASTIGNKTAVSGGDISSDGGATITARGICWSTTTGPTVALTTKTSDGTGAGIFTSNITGLTALTTYYVRAYATNSVGTAYGDEISFTTIANPTAPVLSTVVATAIGSTTATSGGNITSDGGAAVTARGVCWSTKSGPTTALTTKTSDGTGTGTFASNITGLTAFTTYYVKAYATNLVNTVYGNEINFTTGANPVLPTLSTTAASAITTTTATGGGNITSDGGATVTARGVCWGTTSGPTIALTTKTSDGTGAGTFASNITGLTAFTTYYVRAYATNSVGTVYGNEINFTTGAGAGLPTLTTTAASAITTTTATGGGNITSDGGATVTARGICWSTSSSPTVALTTKVSNGTGTGAFTGSMTGLVAGTTYYVRAFATNSAGTAYGNELSFTTTAAPAAPSSGALTISTLTSSVGGGYSPRNIVAIWIKTSTGTFVKSLLVYANARKGDLSNWVSNSGRSAVDAITSATQSSHATRTCTWNATNVSGTVVANGDYKVCMELCDGVLVYHEFTFTKGATAVTLTPANVSGFNSISIKWVPN